jgi:sugar-specific transcriptional regulator TrmB
LKHKLVRRLIADRSQLLGAQQAATLKAVAVEERLARIEQQIQRQNSAYQERIEALTRELIVAKEESRELIRARIAQVKAEMAAARARVMAQTELDDDGGA